MTSTEPQTSLGALTLAFSNVFAVWKDAMKDKKLSVREKLRLFSAVLAESDALSQLGEIDDELKTAAKSPAVMRLLLTDIEEAAPETGTQVELRLEALADFIPQAQTFFLRWTGRQLDVVPRASHSTEEGR